MIQKTCQKASFFIPKIQNMFTIAFLEFIILFGGFSYLATFGLKKAEEYQKKQEKLKKHMFLYK